MGAVPPVRLTRHPWVCACGLAWRGTDERCTRECKQFRGEGTILWSETDARRMEFAQYEVQRGHISEQCELPEGWERPEEWRWQPKS